MVDESDEVGVRQAVGRLIELGLVTADAVAERVSPVVLARTLDYFGRPTRNGALGLLRDLGMTYGMDHKTLQYACEDGVEAYEEEFRSIAAATGGVLTITDVTLVDDEDDHLLQFLCNGVPQTWEIPHVEDDDEGLEARLIFATQLRELTADGSPATWCHVESPPDGYGFFAVFAEHELLNQFGAPYGLTFED
ncbi:hypothetical protein ACFO1B_09185 [Dactylosporangium siamense]|uniref:Uncharacterized protein n=1 Tax=Dactylosporangium siamense TaxID=685454 RepID=A0A919PRF2_9ACTN|nr:hypothetical protein [Dactylosporangium siamense]GIG48862.1 hypothetical protein Dsi01nite_069030 [Dactylosporangium siamense]